MLLCADADYLQATLMLIHFVITDSSSVTSAREAMPAHFTQAEARYARQAARRYLYHTASIVR